MEAMMFVQMDTMIEGLYFIIHRPQDDKSIFLFSFVPRVCILFCKHWNYFS